ncbi:MAG: thiolase family protein [Desulfobacterales bacterium]
MSQKECAIVGLGYTPQGKCPDWTVRELFLEASVNAISDAGMKPHDIDGILVELCWTDPMTQCWSLQQDLGIPELSLSANYDSMGASGGCKIQLAQWAIQNGICKNVLIAFVEKSATAPAVPYRSSPGPTMAYGLHGAMHGIAMAAMRHKLLYGTKSEQLGEVAVTFRKHANLNPNAQMYGRPMTLEDHQNSRMVSEPLHLYDCCLVSDGGRAAVVTSAERAKDCPQSPVYVMGYGQGHVKMDLVERNTLEDTGARLSGEHAFRTAGIQHKDIDVLGLYDATSHNIITQLEELGFCERGEGGAFVENGRLGLDGEFPTNTSGGMLSEAYLQGWTGIPEVVSQLRGNSGERQVKDAKIGLVTNQGGFIAFHSTLILRR